MLHVVNPLVIPSKNTEPTSTEKIGSVRVGSDEDLAVISVNLSSTLKKLCMWEKKLYDEVKVCFTLFQRDLTSVALYIALSLFPFSFSECMLIHW